LFTADASRVVVSCLATCKHTGACHTVRVTDGVVVPTGVANRGRTNWTLIFVYAK